jgi:arylsulfatase A-like enzyme
VKAESPLNPRKMGFDEYLSHDNFFENNPILSRNGAPPERIEGEGSEVVIDAAIQFIDEKAASGQPTFTVVWFGSPHEPYVGLPEDLALYNDLPEKYAGQTTVLTSLETGLNAERPLGEVLRERYAEITAMDRAIGKLRDHLAEAGLRDNTLVWYCGDNGTPPDAPANVSPLRGMKSDMYEGGLRSPSIIEWPARITAPRVSNFNSVTTDTMATLLDIVGAPLPNRPMDGISLLPLIDGKMEERPGPIFFWNYPLESLLARNPEPYIDPALQRGTTPLVKLMDGEAVRTFYNYKQPEIIEEDYTGPRAVLGNRYKLVLDGDPAAKGVELFDMTTDLGEKTNIADANPEIVADYQQQMRTWQESVLNSVRGGDY